MKTLLIALVLCGIGFLYIHTIHAEPALNTQLSGFTTQQETTIHDGIALFNDLVSPNLIRPDTIPMHPEAMDAAALTHCTQTMRGTTVINSSVWIGFNPTYPMTAATVVHELIHALQCVNPQWTAQEEAFAAMHPLPDAYYMVTSSCTCASEYLPRIMQSLYEGGTASALVGRYPDIVRYALNHLENP